MFAQEQANKFNLLTREFFKSLKNSAVNSEHHLYMLHNIKDDLIYFQLMRDPSTSDKCKKNIKEVRRCLNNPNILARMLQLSAPMSVKVIIELKVLAKFLKVVFEERLEEEKAHVEQKIITEKMVEEYNQRIAHLNIENVRLQQKTEKLAAEKYVLQANNQLLADHLNKARAEVHGCAEKLQMYEQSISTVYSERTSLVNQLTKQQREINTLKMKVTNEQDKLEGLRENFKDMSVGESRPQRVESSIRTNNRNGKYSKTHGSMIGVKQTHFSKSVSNDNANSNKHYQPPQNQ